MIRTPTYPRFSIITLVLTDTRVLPLQSRFFRRTSSNHRIHTCFVRCTSEAIAARPFRCRYKRRKIAFWYAPRLVEKCVDFCKMTWNSASQAHHEATFNMRSRPRAYSKEKLRSIHSDMLLSLMFCAMHATIKPQSTQFFLPFSNRSTVFPSSLTHSHPFVQHEVYSGPMRSSPRQSRVGADSQRTHSSWLSHCSCIAVFYQRKRRYG